MLDVSSQVSNSVSPNNPPIHQNANNSQQSQQSGEQQQQYSVQKLALKSTKVKTLNRKVGSKASFRWPF